MADFDGRVVLVTGAGRNIGLAIAERFARDGAAVVVNDLDAAEADAAAERIEAAGGTATGVAGSVASAADAEAMVAAAVDGYGSLDVLVNNAGVTSDAMAHNLTDEQWQMVIDVVLTGTFVMCRAAARALRGSREAPNVEHKKIVNVSSINGIYGIAANANYSAAKAGVIGLTKSLAREWARFRVNVNAVAPGYIAGTRMTSEYDSETGLGMPPDVIDQIEARIPIGRPGQPEDVAAACAWLASSDADYITGQVIEIHGGREIIELV